MILNFKEINISGIKNKLINKEISSLDLVLGCIKKIEETHNDLNAVVIKNFENAIEMAKNADKNIESKNIRALEGIPYISKALFCVKGLKTNACSKMIENYIPPFESTVTQRLKDEGAILLGSANMDEFAMGGSTLNTFYGPTFNPYKRSDGKKVIAGGSSGGSASSVSASLAPFALGSDTGGSVRLPASFCGCVGMKPTFGRVSRFGMIAFASSLDQAGVLTNHVEDAALVLNIISGHDINDSTCSNEAVPNFLNNIDSDIKKLRIGIPKEIMDFDIHHDTKSAYIDTINELEKYGCEIKEISLKDIKHAVSVYYTIAPIEASSNLARYDGIRFGESVNFNDINGISELYVENRFQGFGPEVKRRILLGTFLTSGPNLDYYYNHAKKLRNLIFLEFMNAFNEVDIILTPVAPNVARSIDEKVTVVDDYIADMLTIPASLAGLPAISIPTHFSKTLLPIGMQIIGNKFNEELVFRAGYNIKNMFKHNMISVS
jgi:aspartyl-tRNA(Asn)/glutamyl-tRNA(Gln) amidotransferase subunit A